MMMELIPGRWPVSAVPRVVQLINTGSAIPPVAKKEGKAGITGYIPGRILTEIME